MQDPADPAVSEKSKGAGFRRGAMTLVGVLGLIYLLNPGLGIFELLPDSLPIIGNIDEALAATLVLAALREYGIDLTRWRKALGDKK